MTRVVSVIAFIVVFAIGVWGVDAAKELERAVDEMDLHATR